jgi:hypothetical protein
MKRMSFALLAASATFAMPAHAAWTGLLVDGVLSTNQPSLTQFTSPQVVGAGTEFTGGFTDFFNQVWTIDVDLADTSFTVAITGSVPGESNVGSDGLLGISLSGLTNAAAVTLIGYTCEPSESFACVTFDGGPNLSSYATTETTINATFNTIRDGEVYTFAFVPVAVPEPASWAMMIGGFGLIGGTLRGRRAIAYA